MNGKRWRDERGFAFIETLMAVVFVSISILFMARLWQTGAAQEREAQRQVMIAREAVAALERWKSEQAVAQEASSRSFLVQGASVRETRRVYEAEGLYRIDLTYEWREGERHAEQTWAALHR